MHARDGGALRVMRNLSLVVRTCPVIHVAPSLRDRVSREHALRMKCNQPMTVMRNHFLLLVASTLVAFVDAVCSP